jgi:hypothetical protein
VREHNHSRESKTMTKFIRPVSFAGKTNYAYSVDHEVFNPASLVENKSVPSTSHHIMVIDCSGSMYYSLPQIRETIAKMLVTENFMESEMLFTLITYSSKRDVVTHFARVHARDIANDQYVDEVKSLQTRGATCISQAFELAVSMVQDGEVTAITLHTDGYANDSSFQDEKNRLLLTAAAMPENAFVNTIAYGSYADFVLLDEIAAKGSGVCFQLTSPKQVYDCVRDTSMLVSRSSVPAVMFSTNDADLIAVVGSDGKFVFSAEDVLVRGINANAIYDVYRYSLVAPSTARKNPSNDDLRAYAAMARGWIQQHRVSYAKEIMNGFSGAFVKPFATALSGAAIGKFASAIDGTFVQDIQVSAPYLMVGTTVVDIAEALGLDHGLKVNIKSVYENYRRMGVKSLRGTRNPDGSITPPNVDMVYKESGDFLPIDGFVINREQASVQMRVKRSVQLMRNKTLLFEAKGVSLDGLFAYSQFSLVSSGEVNLSRFRVRFPDTSSPSFARLIQLGVLSENSLDSNMEAEIVLSDYPVTTMDADPFVVNPQKVQELYRLRILSSLIETLTKTSKGADKYTPEQSDALKEIHVTAAMNISMPSTMPYTNLELAVSEGYIDRLPSYSVKVGNLDAFSPADISSANECFKRHYLVDGAKDVKLDALLENSSCVIERKSYTKTFKFSQIDSLVTSIYDVLFLGTEGSVPELSPECVQVFRDRSFTKNVSVLLGEAKSLKREMESVWQEFIAVNFYIGSTGEVPEFLDSDVFRYYGKDEFVAAYPEISVPKAYADATFIVVKNRNGLGEVVFSVIEQTRLIQIRDFDNADAVVHDEE